MRDDTNTNNTNPAYRDSYSKVWFMFARKYFDREITSITALGRIELTRRIRGFRGRFKLDFTEDYLDNISIDRLRHILLAALINATPHS
jgi:hypothetical protein